MTGVTGTPFLVVDDERLEANLARVADRARDAGVLVRPHAKTHKCVEIARRQIAHGAAGLTVATVGEAEVFAAVDEVREIFIAYPLWVTPAMAGRLISIARIVSLRVGIDSAEGARHLADSLHEAGDGGAPLEVVVEIDSGQHRTGTSPRVAGEVARAAVDAGLDVVGVFTFPGHSYGLGDTRARAADQEITALAEAAQGLRANGIEPRVRSGGSTPTVGFTGQLAAGVLTEIRPGVYPFNDAQQVEIGSCTFDDVALTSSSTVVHRNGSRIVVDAGSKILGADRPAWASGFGRLLEHPEARITALSEHHAVIDFPADAAVPALGSVVRVVPNHVCSAVNLVDELVVDDVRWPVAARGRNS